MLNAAKDKTLGITAQDVRELFDYNPQDGHLRWKVARQRITKGSIAGSVSKSDGYRYICFDYQDLLAHRAIWLWVTGEWPKCQIDHIDKNRSNNVWTNLREATNSQNMRNVGESAQRNNKSTKYRGIDIRRGRYRVRIHAEGKEIVVGRFTSLQEAKAARRKAEKDYWGPKPLSAKRKPYVKVYFDEQDISQMAYDLHISKAAVRRSFREMSRDEIQEIYSADKIVLTK